MIDISEMQTNLESLLTRSKLDMLFKPGRIKIRSEKLPHSVNIRLKLHNPYTFTAFEITEKKSGIKFAVCHLKTMPKELRLELLALGGAPDNSSTRFEFPFEKSEDIAKTLFKLCMTPEIVEVCGAKEYKPYKLITAAASRQS